MISPDQERGIRERLEHCLRSIADGSYSTHDLSLSVAEEYVEDIRDLLTSLDEMRADNAALTIHTERYLEAVERLGEMENGKTLFEQSPTKNQRCYDAWMELNNAGSALNVVLHGHPGTALLDRHAEELAGKDAEIARLKPAAVAAVRSLHDYLNAIRKGLGLPSILEPEISGWKIISAIEVKQAELARTRQALRNVWIKPGSGVIGGAGGSPRKLEWGCRCGASWFGVTRNDDEPAHNSITLPGDTEPGPCPATPSSE